MQTPAAHILGLGIDLVEIARFRELLDNHSERFLERCFTPGEQAYQRGSRRYHEHLAARFAAKEAALKALGTGLANGVAWTDIEVCTEPEGGPSLRVGGRASELAAARGISCWHVSLSHTEANAIAIVLASARFVQ